MRLLADVARTEFILLMSLLLIAASTLALTGRIRIAGVLKNKKSGGFDPGRLQLLVLTGLFALLMLTQLEQMRAANEIGLPSNVLLYALGGSEGLYLIRKYFQSRPQPKGE